jgi:hypothetical protein
MRPVLSTNGRNSWLSLTPEPERELPAAVATLRANGPPATEAVRLERERVERLVVRGRRRAWLEYLRGVVALIERTAGTPDREVERARAVAIDVIRNHHRLLLGVPGRAAEHTERDRLVLEGAGRTTQPDDEGAR